MVHRIITDLTVCKQFDGTVSNIVYTVYYEYSNVQFMPQLLLAVFMYNMQQLGFHHYQLSLCLGLFCCAGFYLVTQQETKSFCQFHSMHNMLLVRSGMSKAKQQLFP